MGFNFECIWNKENVRNDSTIIRSVNYNILLMNSEFHLGTLGAVLRSSKDFSSEWAWKN